MPATDHQPATTLDNSEHEPAKMTKATAPASEFLTEHARLTAQITEIDREISAVSEQRDAAETDRRNALDRELQAVGAVEQRLTREQARDPDERRLAIETDPAVIEARAEMAEAARRVEAVNARDRALTQQRHLCVQARLAVRPTSLDELLALQARIKAAREEVESLQTHLAAQRATTRPALPDLDDINQRLSAAMARVELGEASRGEVEAVEKERALATKAHAKAVEEIERAALLARGLEDRLETERAKLAELEAAGRVALAWYMREQFEQAASDYRDAAAQTFAAHGRLTALARIIEQSDADAGRALHSRYGRLLRFTCTLEGVNDERWIDDPAHRERAADEALDALQGIGLRLIAQ